MSNAGSDGVFLALLDELRTQHEQLLVQHERRVAELEAEVFQLKQHNLEQPGQSDTEEKNNSGAAGSEWLKVTPAFGCQSCTAVAAASRPPSPSRGSEKRHSLKLVDQAVPAHEIRWSMFDAAIGFCILLSIAVMFLSLQEAGLRNGAELLGTPYEESPGLDKFLVFAEHVFNTVFLVEFLLRVFFFRSAYVYEDNSIQWFNLFDASLVWFTVTEAYILPNLSLNVSFMRSVRIVRLLRTLRMVRTVRFFSSLRILVATVAASFLALFWSMVLLALVMVMGALTLCQILSGIVLDEGVDEEARRWVFRYYGTPGRALWSVFELTFSGGWPNYARTLVEDVSPWFVVFFAVYISGVVFAMFRIVTALFLKDTLAIANSDADMQIQVKMKEKQMYATKLLSLFHALDARGDGIITEAEFHAVLKEPRAAAYLASLEIEASESKSLFDAIDDGDGVVSAEEFVSGALRLKGHGRAQDVITILHELRKLKETLGNIELVAANSQQALRDLRSRQLDSEQVSKHIAPSKQMLEL